MDEIIKNEAKAYTQNSFKDWDDKTLKQCTIKELMRFVEESVMYGAELVLDSSRWRKVSEELPEDNKDMTALRLNTTSDVIVRTKSGNLYIDHRVFSRHKNIDGWIEFWNWSKFNNYDIVEWKPIH